jgi:hypothetical protein
MMPVLAAATTITGQQQAWKWQQAEGFFYCRQATPPVLILMVQGGGRLNKQGRYGKATETSCFFAVYFGYVLLKHIKKCNPPLPPQF